MAITTKLTSTFRLVLANSLPTTIGLGLSQGQTQAANNPCVISLALYYFLALSVHACYPSNFKQGCTW